SLRRPHARASMEPRQSGSGSTWPVLTKEAWRASDLAIPASGSAGLIPDLLPRGRRPQLRRRPGHTAFGRLGRLRLGRELAQQTVDAVTPFDGIVQPERNFRGMPQPDAAPQLAADKPLGVVQCLQRLRLCLVVAENADVNFCVAQI